MEILRSLVKNTGFSLTAELVNRGANGFLFVIISRSLGAREAGIYTLAFSYTMLTARLALWGLDQLLIREISKTPSEIGKFFSNFLILRVVLAIAAWCLLWQVTALSLAHQGSRTRLIVLLVALCVLPDNVSNLSEAVFVARRRMSMVVSTRLIAASIRVVGGLAVLLLGGGLIKLALVVLIGSSVRAAFALFAVSRQFLESAQRWDLGFCIRQLRDALPLIAGGGFQVLDDRLGVLIISFFLTESEVGIYSAAATVVSSLLVLPHAYQMAVFPAMSRLYAVSQEKLGKLYRYSLRYMLILALPLAISLAFLSDFVVALFGPDFGSASSTLRILVWLAPMLFINVPTARLLIAGGNQSVVARALGIRLITGTLASIALVQQYGGLGVAAGRLASTLLMVAFNYASVRRHVRLAQGIRTAVRIALAASGMVVVLLLSRSLLPWAVLVGGCTYILILLVGGALSKEERVLLTSMMNRVVNHSPRKHDC